MSNGDDSDVLNPRSEDWISEFLEREDEIINLFCEIRSTQLYDASLARERLRQFAGDSKRQDAFLASYFAIDNVEPFLDDVEEIHDEETRKKVEDFGERFSDFSTEISAVYDEVNQSHWNPITSQDAEIEASIGDEALPVITYRAFSGDHLVYKSSAMLSNHLSDAASLLNFTVNKAERHTESYSNSNQLEEIKTQHAHIRHHLKELEEFIIEAGGEVIDEDEIEFHNE